MGKSRTFLIFVAVMLGLSVPGVAVAASGSSTPTTAPTTSTTTAKPAGSSATSGCSTLPGLHAAFVIDFGPEVADICVKVGDSATYESALTTLSKGMGWVPPRFASSGLLCAIDNRPVKGCGTQHGQHYAYWSSWWGRASGWTYVSDDPFTAHVEPGKTSGWRWEPNGNANPNDPKPRGPSAASRVCPNSDPSGVITCQYVGSPGSSPPPVTTTTTSPTTVVAPTTTASTSTTTLYIPAPKHPGTTTTTTTTPKKKSKKALGKSKSKSKGNSKHRSSGSTSGVGSTSTTTSVAAGQLAAPGSAGHHGSGSSPLPYILVAAVVLLGGGGAWWLKRRRSGTPGI